MNNENNMVPNHQLQHLLILSYTDLGRVLKHFMGFFTAGFSSEPIPVVVQLQHCFVCVWFME